MSAPAKSFEHFGKDDTLAAPKIKAAGHLALVRGNVFEAMGSTRPATANHIRPSLALLGPDVAAMVEYLGERPGSAPEHSQSGPAR